MPKRWSPSFTHNLEKKGLPQVAPHKSGQQSPKPGTARVHPGAVKCCWETSWPRSCGHSKVRVLQPWLGPPLRSPHSPEKSPPDSQPSHLLTWVRDAISIPADGCLPPPGPSGRGRGEPSSCALASLPFAILRKALGDVDCFQTHFVS